LKGLIKNTRKALGFFIKLAAILSIIMLMYGVFLFVSYKKAVAPAVTDPQFSAVDSVYLSMPAKGTQLAYAPVPVSPDTRSWIDLMPDKTGEASGSTKTGFDRERGFRAENSRQGNIIKEPGAYLRGHAEI